jgi:hypothetical protein
MPPSASNALDSRGMNPSAKPRRNPKPRNAGCGGESNSTPPPPAKVFQQADDGREAG